MSQFYQVSVRKDSGGRHDEVEPDHLSVGQLEVDVPPELVVKLLDRVQAFRRSDDRISCRLIGSDFVLGPDLLNFHLELDPDVLLGRDA